MFTDRAVYGLKEIAEELGISHDAIKQRRHRGQLPAPTEELSSGPVYAAEVLREFFEEEK